MQAINYEPVYSELNNDLLVNFGMLLSALSKIGCSEEKLVPLKELAKFEKHSSSPMNELLLQYSSNFVTLCETLKPDGMSQENKVEIAELLISLSTIIEMIIIDKATVEYGARQRDPSHDTFLDHYTSHDRNDLDTTIVIHGFMHFLRAQTARKRLVSMILGNEIFEDSFHNSITQSWANFDRPLADQYVIILMNIVSSQRHNWYDDGDGTRSFLRSYRRAVADDRDILANETSHARDLGRLHYLLDRYIARIKKKLAA